MITVPRWISLGTNGTIGVYSIGFAAIQIGLGRLSVSAGVALCLFVLAFVLCLFGRTDAHLPLWRTGVGVAAGVLLPVLGSIGLTPGKDTYSSGAWYVGATACLTIGLLWRRRAVPAWIIAGFLVLHTFAWGGLEALDSFAVIAAVLLMAVVSAGGWAAGRAEQELRRYSAVERETLEWRAAQDAYHEVRQVRLATTAKLASPLLQRIVEAGGALSEADRFECRVLEETIRDEIRGRRLLNDAIREQVIAHRRRGAIVQINDDGGLDDLTPDEVQPMLDQIARAIEGLQSDRIIIRTRTKESGKAVSVVAMSSDPIAAALGIDDDDDDRVDLWLEIDRPGIPAPAIA